MDHHEKSLRIGATAVLCALCLRLSGSGAMKPVVSWLSKPNTQAFLIYLETGRNVRFSPSNRENVDFSGESAAPVIATETVPEPLRFTAGDASALEVTYSCGYRPDLTALLTQPLEWDLTTREPTVLIIHTHTTESYTKSEGEVYTESSAFRTLDESYNMISVGDRLAEVLTAGGITVLHDRSLHDYPSYNGSYAQTREATSQWLAQYPSIRLILDLHRDASGDLNNQLRTVVTADGEDYARMMLVMGTNASGLDYPKWQENLSLALKLQAVLEQQTPGITRPISLRSTRFNQDLSTGSLLIEMGAAGNSHKEALRAVEKLGQAILALQYGSR